MPNAKIIDADGHVQDRDAEIRKFMEEPYCRRRGPLVAKDKWDSSMYGKLNRDIHDVPTRLNDMDRVSHQRLRYHAKPGERLCRRLSPRLQRLDRQSL